MFSELFKNTYRVFAKTFRQLVMIPVG